MTARKSIVSFKKRGSPSHCHLLSLAAWNNGQYTLWILASTCSAYCYSYWLLPLLSLYIFSPCPPTVSAPIRTRLCKVFFMILCVLKWIIGGAFKILYSRIDTNYYKFRTINIKSDMVVGLLMGAVTNQEKHWRGVLWPSVCTDVPLPPPSELMGDSWCYF